MGQNASAKQKHDALLALKPSEASHDEALCVLCNEEIGGTENTTNDPTPGGGDMSQYTEEDLRNAVATETQPLKDELEALRASQEQQAVEDRIAEITEAHEAEKAELQGQLDTANAATTAATKQYEDLVALLVEAQAEEEARKALAERTEAVRAVVSDRFTEEYVDQNIDRWAALAAEDFESLVEDWDAAAKAAKTDDKTDGGDTSEDKILESSAMTASADNGSSNNEASLSEVRMNLMRNRRQFRSINTV